MIKLTELLSQIIQECVNRNLNEKDSTIFEECHLFLELADPNASYKYKEISLNVWEFQDRYSNVLGVEFNPGNKYVDAYYKMKDLNGREVKVFDYESNKDALDPLSFQGGSDERRSDTICKILRDEVIPKYLINKNPQLIKLHPLNDYRYKIFMKCAEICKEKYPQIEIKEAGKEIHLINK